MGSQLIIEPWTLLAHEHVDISHHQNGLPNCGYLSVFGGRVQIEPLDCLSNGSVATFSKTKKQLGKSCFQNISHADAFESTSGITVCLFPHTWLPWYPGLY